MLQGTDAVLLSSLAQYGYSLLNPERMSDPNELLARLAKSRDSRLLEGFPVVLANALEKHREKVDMSAAEGLLDASELRRFRKLTALSTYLFGSFGLDALKAAAREAGADHPDLLAELRSSVENDRSLELGPGTLNLARVKKTFLNYYVHGRELETAENKARLREDFRREYNLSLFFAPRQRDLLGKKLRGEAMTKTEREYFSRVVKKKLLALADPDLHRLAQKALQET
ncbi:MAG: hypothetical protein HYZ75_09760 [Elusimicrobia bacterium]|nr:hypothetical protein [Elusimicrobiota bacterium]